MPFVALNHTILTIKMSVSREVRHFPDCGRRADTSMKFKARLTLSFLIVGFIYSR